MKFKTADGAEYEFSEKENMYFDKFFRFGMLAAVITGILTIPLSVMTVLQATSDISANMFWVAGVVAVMTFAYQAFSLYKCASFAKNVITTEGGDISNLLQMISYIVQFFFAYTLSMVINTATNAYLQFG